MRTIENPLVLREGNVLVLKSAAGEYVSKHLAEEMLKALYDYYKILDHVGTLPENKLKIFNLILKAKGQ